MNTLSKCIAFIAAMMAMPSFASNAAEETTAGSDTIVIAPPTTFAATRGLSQTLSAETMGAGRLTFSLNGTWYRQQKSFASVPEKNADIATGSAAFSFGVSRYFDVFAGVAGYGLLASTNDYGLGSVNGGIQGSLPLPGVSPLYLGAMLEIVGGTSANQIDSNYADGYDYFDTRTNYDFIGKLLQTLAFGSESNGIKFHFNEGVVFTLQASHDKLLLLGGGIQWSSCPLLVVGVEANSRTKLDKLNNKTDPLWLTPSVQIRTPYYFNVCLGGDIALSKQRTEPDARALEPYRLFGNIVFSFDLLAGKRREAREKAKHEAEEKAAMERKAQEAQARSDSLARKAHEDSVAMALEREAERRRADSLMQKAREDSIILAETNKKLAEERSKRSDAEKQLLSTGLLLLDAVYFESGKAEISINSRPYLNIIGKMLTKYPKLLIEVAGHTDNVGSFDMNMKLSQARAEAVRLYLIQVSIELGNRVSARGYGSTQPKATNANAQGRKRNRRVELQVLNKEVLKEYN